MMEDSLKFGLGTVSRDGWLLRHSSHCLFCDNEFFRDVRAVEQWRRGSFASAKEVAEEGYLGRSTPLGLRQGN